MKKILSAALSVALIAALAACEPKDDTTTTTAAGGGDGATTTVGNSSGKTVINMYAFTEEVPNMWKKYIEIYPEIGEKYECVPTVIATDGGGYQNALDQALSSGAGTAPDIFAAEAAFVLKYTKYDAADYAETYKNLGIDVDNLITAGEIAAYSIDVGSNQAGEVVGLGYQAVGGCAIYRSSIAKEVFGTDDPEQIKDVIGPGFDKFFAAADTLKAAGYKIVSGDGDVWHLVENGSPTPWVEGTKFQIDPSREAFFDTSKKLYDGNYTNKTTDWEEGWFGDMKGIGETPAFMFFGPAWLLNYSINDNTAETDPSYHDWKVTTATEPFFWGGTYLIGTKTSTQKEAVGDFIEWVTLDTSETGLQYFWANGTFNPESPSKDVVASGVVMAKSNGENPLLGGQNMFDYYIPANAAATAKSLTQYDETINTQFREQVRLYAAGEKSKEQAIADLKTWVADNLGLEV